jgi:hypothetical protein
LSEFEKAYPEAVVKQATIETVLENKKKLNKHSLAALSLSQQEYRTFRCCNKICLGQFAYETCISLRRTYHTMEFEQRWTYVAANCEFSSGNQVWQHIVFIESRLHKSFCRIISN